MRSERQIVFLIGAVQFVNILDFVMVMPLGPDFARALGIAVSNLGWIGGSYTAAAAVAGFAGSYFLDRFDRKRALVATMAGLAVGTALGGVAWNLPTLLFARVVAGAFGGPATSLSFSIIADVIPVERRGRAMGAVMGAFAVASILGVPAGLELARLGTWQWPFFATALLGFVITAAIAATLPSLRGHLTLEQRSLAVGTLVRPEVLLSYAMTAFSMAGGFIIIPNISAYIQGNLHFPRERIGMLYTGGGAISFFATRFAGKLVDRLGSLRVCIAGVAMLAATIYVGFVLVPPPIPVWALFMLFMLAMGFRNVAHTALTSKVPAPHERAKFMSLQSTVQHLASAGGAILSSYLLVDVGGGQLSGMTKVAASAIGLNLVLPLFMGRVEGSVMARVRGGR